MPYFRFATSIFLVMMTVVPLHGDDGPGFDPANYEKVLIPLAFSGSPRSGAHGSVWITELWIRNEDEEPVVLAAGRPECIFGCQGNTYVTFPAKKTGPYSGHATWPLSRGLLIYVDKTKAHQIHFNLRIRDLSRQLQTAGTELPVLRPSELLTRTAHLLNIPQEPGFRVHLRLYTLPKGAITGLLRVRFIDQDREQLLEERPVFLDGGGYEDDFPSFPAYAEVLVPTYAGVSSLRIEIESPTEGVRFWAFASITHNETQHVTIVTPQ